MSVNLLELVKGQVGSQIVRQISGLLGENEVATQKAIDSAVPSLIGGLMKQASTGEGVNALTQTLDKFDDGFLSNLGASLSGGGEKGLMNIGSGLLKMLFGGKLGNLTDILGKVSGLGKGSLGSLLGVLAPIVIGMLGQQKKKLGLDAAGLTKMLMGQKDHIAGLLPAGLSDTLGLDQVMGDRPAAKAAQGVASAAQAGTQKGGSFLSKVIPIALIAGIGYFAYQYMTGQSGESVEAAGTATDTTAQLTGVFDSFRGAFDGITDAASAEAAVPALEEASRDLDGIASGFSALPDGVKTAAGSMISGFLPNLEEMLGRVMSLDGVKDLLEPVVGGLVDKLKGLI